MSYETSIMEGGGSKRKGYCSFKRKLAESKEEQEKGDQPQSKEFQRSKSLFPEANSHFNVSVNGSRLSSLFFNLLFFCIMLQSHIDITEGRMDE